MSNNPFNKSKSSETSEIRESVKAPQKSNSFDIHKHLAGLDQPRRQLPANIEEAVDAMRDNVAAINVAHMKKAICDMESNIDEIAAMDHREKQNKVSYNPLRYILEKRKKVKEEKFSLKLQKYLERADLLQAETFYYERDRIDRLIICKTIERIDKMAKWIEDNDQHFAQPSADYFTKKEAYKEHIKILNYFMHKNGIVGGFTDLRCENQKIEFRKIRRSIKKASVDFLKQIKTRLQSAGAGGSTQAGPSTIE